MRGALLEMCWHLVPVAAIWFAILVSQRLPAALEGSNSCVTRVAAPTLSGTFTVHRVVAEISEEAGEEIHVGDAGEGVLGELRKSSMVISPYFFFNSSVRVRPKPVRLFKDVADRPGVGGKACELFLFGEGRRWGSHGGSERDAGCTRSYARGLEEVAAAKGELLMFHRAL